MVSSGFCLSVAWLLTLWRSAGTLESSVLPFYTIFQHSYTIRLIRVAYCILNKVLPYHDWLLDRDDTSISHFDTGIEGGVVSVSSMSSCDTAACLASGTAVHFGAHPTLTRVVHLWAGRRRWRPQHGNSNRLSPAGAVMQANVCAMNACKSRTYK